MQSKRAAALKDILGRLQRADAASAAHSMLPSVWPQMLKLLGDPSLEVRQHAAPVVGQLGALAARQGARPGTSSLPPLEPSSRRLDTRFHKDVKLLLMIYQAAGAVR